MSAPGWFESALLEGAGIAHGFGTPGAAPPFDLLTARQVHGDRILWVEAGGDPSEEEADALATAEARAVAVRTADCVPLLIADRRGGRVAAVHAGWRGSRARIGARAVEVLLAAGARAEDLVAAIGPCIGRCCYEVAPALAAEFEAAFGPEVREGRHLDLVFANRRTLLEAGIAPEGIEALGLCTFCDRRFASYRREGASAGRQLSFVCGRSLS